MHIVEEQVNILDRLSNHFGLKWTGEKTASYAKDVLQYYAQIYTDQKEVIYYLTIDKQKLKLGTTMDTQVILNNLGGITTANNYGG